MNGMILERMAARQVLESSDANKIFNPGYHQIAIWPEH